MEKYFSSIICRKGYCSAFNTIYKKDVSSRAFILSDGDDTERAVFLKGSLKISVVTVFLFSTRFTTNRRTEFS